jgi:hypothetical protein
MCSFAMIDVMNVFSLSCGALNLILTILPHIVHDPVVSSLLLCATCFFLSLLLMRWWILSRFPTSGLLRTKGPGCLGAAELWTAPMVECYLELQLEKGSVGIKTLWCNIPNESDMLCLQPHVISLFCRIIRAFLVEEQKIVKKVLKIQKTKDKGASK